MKVTVYQSPVMTCRYDSTEWLDAYSSPCAAEQQFSGSALGPGSDVSLAIGARKTRCIVKRTRNGARIKFFHFIEVDEPVEKDKVVDQVAAKRRYRSTGPAFALDLRDFKVREMLRSRSVIRSLDKVLSMSLSNGLPSGNQRRDRPASGAEDCTDCARECGDGGCVHDEKQVWAKDEVIEILARSPFAFFSKMLRRGGA